MQKLETNIGDDSIFRILNRQGIISFTDYIFLLTLLSSRLFSSVFILELLEIDFLNNFSPFNYYIDS